MRVRPLLAGAVLASVSTLVGPTTAIPAGSASTANVVTPGNFRGYGFDQCLAPTQAKMDAWMEYSPFSAVGTIASSTARGVAAWRATASRTKAYSDVLSRVNSEGDVSGSRARRKHSEGSRVSDGSMSGLDPAWSSERPRSVIQDAGSESNSFFPVPQNNQVILWASRFQGGTLFPLNA